MSGLMCFVLFALGGFSCGMYLAKEEMYTEALWSILIGFFVGLFMFLFLRKKSSPTTEEHVKERKDKKHRAPLMVHWPIIITVLYGILLLVSAFGDMSSSYHVFFKILSLLYFGFMALMFFSVGRLVPVLVGFVNSGIVVFFIDSFARYHDSYFWKVFDFVLLGVVIFEYLLPSIMGKHGLD